MHKVLKVRKKEKKIDSIFFIIFLCFYFTVGTSLSLPKGEVLRWIGCFILGIIGLMPMIKEKNELKIWPSYYNFLIFPTIISLCINPQVFFTGFFRFGSFILFITSLFLYYYRKKVNCEYIKKDFKKFSVIVIFLILVQFVMFIFNLSELGKFHGMYGNKNYLATISSVSLICLIWMFINSKKSKFFIIILFVSNITVSIATGSRTAIVCLGIILFSLPFIIFKQNNIGNKIKALLIELALLILIFFLCKHIEIPALKRLLDSQAGNAATGFSRDIVWEQAFIFFKQKPLLGWGNSASYYNIYKLNKGLIWGFHNSYLVILIENGICGTIFYILFFLCGFYINSIKYKKAKLNSTDNKFVKILFLICLVLLINAISESFLFAVGNPMSVCFWLPFIMLDRFLDIKLNSTEEVCEINKEIQIYT
ncbi:O-antigen ligase family protein [Clostridium tarantellae]|uniref:O-antigen ligase-related domain-containing protein n=1 Tax=Clostridium tarantellae TaxID=39493 RepID=A0A6I1MQ85_9CLOT|nr:O-antigen ligase family protein [Clostridium tarantellae]MPQ44412.1 hypothetical protein [Clostridium tarantellae]